MNSLPSSNTNTTAHVYVVKLFAEPGQATAGIRGRLEHVKSGRRREFDSGEALLACIAQEEAQAALDAESRRSRIASVHP
jgi:hypothetical protein